jgi:LysR family glycine cleavage system transcriptional activator
LTEFSCVISPRKTKGANPGISSVSLAASIEAASRRPEIATLTPSFERLRAIAFPNPSLPPVTIATLVSKLRSIYLTYTSCNLRSLEVFEVAARRQSITAAAGELHITQSAVSRQVQELEKCLNVKLFIRSGPHLKVTAMGEALAKRIGLGMGTLQEAVHLARSTSQSRFMTLSILPSLNTKWFAPRLGKFIQSHPNFDLSIAATQKLVVDFDAEEIDAAICYGEGNWDNLNVELLAEETVTPVCSPAYAEQMGLKVPSDLHNVTLLQTEGKDNWGTWFRAAGIDHHASLKGPYLSDGSATLQAVINSQGVALGRSVLIDDDLQAGRIIAPFQLKLKASYSYWFVTPLHESTSANLIAL